MYLTEDQIDTVSNQSVIVPSRSRFCVSETLLEQGSGQVNEDAVYANDQRCVVCDGATSLDRSGTSGNLPGTTGGQQAAALTAEAFASDLNLIESARKANEMIRERMFASRVDFSRREALWSTSFAAVEIHEGSIDWCQIGDCMILVVYDDGRSGRLTDLPGQDAEVLKTWKRIGFQSHGTIHQVLAEKIGEVRRSMNRVYGVLNGEDEALTFVSHGTIDTDHITDILLFSDGLFPPSSNPELPFDDDLFVTLYQKGGLRKVRDYVRSIQQEDPGCYHYPRFKMFDDIGGIALRKCQVDGLNGFVK